MGSEPRPLGVPAPYEPYCWPRGKRIPLCARTQPIDLDLLQLLESRESKRAFGGTPSDEQLGEFFWLACRNRSCRPGPFGFDQESRVHPSAGAVHPIHTLVNHRGNRWMRYDPVTHELEDVPSSEDGVAAARKAASELLDVGRGALLALVAEPDKTAAKYAHHESLVWRDAGVLLGYMSLAAEALHLSFCPLGITGQPRALQGLPEPDRLWSAGLAVLGTTAEY